jgi:P-type E1-E2 ATPase
VDVPLGARVLVAPGQRVPADGVVVAGASAADESMLTGEAAPVDKGLGDEVLGGTVNVGDAALEVGVRWGCEELRGSWGSSGFRTCFAG